MTCWSQYWLQMWPSLYRMQGDWGGGVNVCRVGRECSLYASKYGHFMDSFLMSFFFFFFSAVNRANSIILRFRFVFIPQTIMYPGRNQVPGYLYQQVIHTQAVVYQIKLKLKQHFQWRSTERWNRNVTGHVSPSSKSVIGRCHGNLKQKYVHKYITHFQFPYTSGLIHSYI